MEKSEDLVKLAEVCLATAKQIKDYFSSNGLSPMSFDQNGPATFPDATPEIQHARMHLREAAIRLSDLVAGPEDVLTSHAYQCSQDASAFRYINKYKVAGAVPFNKTISYEDVASKLGLDASQLQQVLRKLMHIHVFCEPEPGQIAHTAASKLLLHPGVGSFNNYITDDTFAMASRQIEALEKWGHGSQETSEAALNYYYNTSKQMFQYYEEERPETAKVFANMMSHVSNMYPMSNLHVANGFDWASLPDGATVVDVAGNLGHCSIPIIQTNPNLKIIVQDLPKIVDHASDPESSIIPPLYRDRITFMAHDFYTPQPVPNVAVYFVRMIMHDYPDKYCVKILRPLVTMLEQNPKDCRLVITDQLLPPAGQAPWVVERFMRTQDMQMMMLSNAKERDLREWKKLFRLTDPRLRIKNIVTPHGSAMSFLEVVLDVDAGVDQENGHAV